MKRNPTLQLFLAELLGNTMFAFFAEACVAQMFFGTALDLEVGLQTHKSSIYISYSRWLNYAIGTGLSYSVSKAVVCSIKGVGINPAFTVAASVLNIKDSLPWRKAFLAIAAQYLGGLLGAGLVYSVYNVQLSDLIKANIREARRIFASYPISNDEKSVTLIWDQILASIVITVVYLASNDFRPDGFMLGNFARSLPPMLTGLCMTAVQLSNGILAGISANPARDFSSRLFSAIWFGDEVWTLPHKKEGDEFSGNNRHYFWMPMILPYLGSLLGTFVYTIAVKVFTNWSGPKESREKLTQKEQHLKELKQVEKRLNKLNHDLREGNLGAALGGPMFSRIRSLRSLQGGKMSTN